MSEKLSSEQKNLIAQRVNEGDTLSDIQKYIKSEFGISMTYIDVRFLVDDLDLSLKDKTPPPATTPEIAPAPAPAAGNEIAPPENTPPPAAGTRLTISVDPVQQPGVALGGSVTFSDGKRGQWQLDSYGQLGFVPPEPNYRPTPEDTREFQVALQKELAKLGYA